MGGLARKATIVDEEKQKNDNVIILDAGNLFFKKNQLSDIDRDDLKINARIIRDAYNTIGCNAFNPGEKDFAAGLDYLLELKKESNKFLAVFPFKVNKNILSISRISEVR